MTALPITDIAVSNDRGIRTASCSSVPPVMVITGPNGSGKSTLLIAIKRQSQSTQPIYIGPHRSIRRQNIQSRWLGPQLKLSDILTSDNVSQVDGIRVYDQARDPWNADESGNLIKYTLCNIATDVNNRIASLFHRDGEIKKDTIPDVWNPLSKLIDTLLPHMQFVEVNVSEKTDMKVLFRNIKTESVIEFDNLSSGEKSIVQLFLPLIEHEILHNLKLIEEPLSKIEWKCRPVIIDEPELHLHPNLQELLLSYMRELAAARRYQFMISSHSQVLVEAANHDELYLMRPVHSVADGENQLVRIADDESRLDLINEVFGRRSDLTAMKSIVIVEGKELTPNSQSSSDRKIYGLLDNRFRRITVTPSSSKSECIARARNLSDMMKSLGSNAQVRALVDRDVDTETHDESVQMLPVSMVENFLIDPAVIFEALELVIEKTDFERVSDVEQAITSILDSMENHEVERRVKASLGTKIFRVKGPLALAERQIEEHLQSINSTFSTENIYALREKCEKKVAQIKHSNSRREFYDGKYVIDNFVKIYLKDTGLSKEIFKYQCARIASKRNKCKSFFDGFFKNLF